MKNCLNAPVNKKKTGALLGGGDPRKRWSIFFSAIGNHPNAFFVSFSLELDRGSAYSGPLVPSQIPHSWPPLPGSHWLVHYGAQLVGVGKIMVGDALTLYQWCIKYLASWVPELKAQNFLRNFWSRFTPDTAIIDYACDMISTNDVESINLLNDCERRRRERKILRFHELKGHWNS